MVELNSSSVTNATNEIRQMTTCQALCWAAKTWTGLQELPGELALRDTATNRRQEGWTQQPGSKGQIRGKEMTRLTLYAVCE